MTPTLHTLFQLPAFRPLLAIEHQRIRAAMARQPAGPVLWLRAPGPCGAASRARNRNPVLALQAAGPVLSGDLHATPAALPLATASVRLVVVQHAGELLADAATLTAELQRVLQPGGELLWFGLNPWSPWLAWAHWQTGFAAAPRAMHADVLRRALVRSGLAVGPAERLGSCWPGGPEAPPPVLAGLRAAWCLQAWRRTGGTIALRPQRRRAGTRPQLAAGAGLRVPA